MAQESGISDKNYRRFIEQVLETGEVWGLRGEDGWAYCASNEYEDTEVLVFWSDRARAQKHAIGEWSEHEPVAISLDEFIDNWLQGMDDDGALVGPNWEEGLDGIEVEPSEMAELLTSDEA